jgi:hypothetical protein
VTQKAKAMALRAELSALVAEYVRTNPGLTNAEIAAALGLESSYAGGQRNYLTFSLLGDGLSGGLIARKQDGRNIRYVPK